MSNNIFNNVYQNSLSKLNFEIMKTEDKSLVHPNDRREQSINTWERAYLLTLKTERAYRLRLKELQSWDNTNGNVYEHDVKVEALQRLLGI